MTLIIYSEVYLCVCQQQNDMLETEVHLPHLCLVWSLQSIVQQFINQNFSCELCLN